jgi:hypothetical protein
MLIIQPIQHLLETVHGLKSHQAHLPALRRNVFLPDCLEEQRPVA